MLEDVKVVIWHITPSPCIIDVFQFSLACICNCTLYTCIVRRLNKRNGRNQSRERNHVAKMIVINLCVFFICLVPIQLLNLAHFALDILGLLADSFGWIAVVAASLNSTVKSNNL